MFRHTLTLACLCSFLSGCSLIVASKLDDIDSGARDGGTSDGSIADSGMDMTADGGDVDAGLTDCTGMDDGHNCSPGGVGTYICVNEACAQSECGDTYIDTAAGEQCEDGNDNSNDGCEPSTCHYSCSANEECANGNDCDGNETCNVGLHRCQAAGVIPAEGSECTTTSGSGVCRSGSCASALCGDGTIDSTDGEECDDMNTDPADGCENDCHYSCHTDDDCGNSDVCDGIEKCDGGTHMCAGQPAPNCDDSMPCTADSCDPISGCANKLQDTDGDGFSWVTCYAGYQVDCNDGDNTIFPGAPLMCDHMDHNCDGMNDDGAVASTCYNDADMDSYGNAAATMSACMCPEGYIPARADGAFDCVDSQPMAYPMAPDFHTEYASCRRGTAAACLDPNFDWNCDGTAERQYTTFSSGCYVSSSGACVGAGWTGTEMPDCGHGGQYRTCYSLVAGSCSAYLSTFTQGCR